MRSPAARRFAAGLAIALLPATPPARAQSAPVVFAGLEHEALGSATLSVDSTRSSLLIEGLGANGGGVAYALDAAGGSIRFGDGLAGRVPSTGSWGVQAGYRNGGGSSGRVSGLAGPNGPMVELDHGPVGTNSVQLAVREDGQLVHQGQYAALLAVGVAAWPNEVALEVVAGEMQTGVRWDQPVSMVLPGQLQVAGDELVATSETGGALSGLELGTLSWEGTELGPVEFLGERFRQGSDWFELSGNIQLQRTTDAHELTHVVQQGSRGSYMVFPAGPCPPDPRSLEGLAAQSFMVSGGPEEGTGLEHFLLAEVEGQRVRIPAHSSEWTNFQTGDPGVSILGLFDQLGATSYTVQAFHDGALVESVGGLAGELARVPQYVVQHEQTDWDFLHQRASTQLDFGQDVAVTLMAPRLRTVVADRLHIVPEQLSAFPDCIVGVGLGTHKVPDITLKRGVVGQALPPAWFSGVEHRATGDAVLFRRVDGQLELANEYWGAGAGGPLEGSVRSAVAGLVGFGWGLGGALDPASLPASWGLSLRATTQDANGGEARAGLDITAENGLFAIRSDLVALGSADADLTLWLDGVPVASAVLSPQEAVLAPAQPVVAEYRTGPDGLDLFALSWDAPQSLRLGGNSFTADRVSSRLRHRDRLVTVQDFELLARDSPGVPVARASVRPHRSWLTAVGDVRYSDLPAEPFPLEHLDPSVPSGVEVEAEEDPQGNPHVQLVLEDPALANTLDGDEQLFVQLQEEDPAIAPGLLTVARNAGEWGASVDFADAGYTGFRVLADGVGELYASSTPSGDAFTSDRWPRAWIVKGVGDELWLRIAFADGAAVSTPGSSANGVAGLTVVLEGANRPPFGAGHARFLMQGVSTTMLVEPAVAVGVPGEDAPPPGRAVARLLGATPNPFNPRTTLRLELDRPGRAELVLYDLAGRRVRTLLDGPQPAGVAEVVWDGRDGRGRAVASGSYLVELRALGQRDVEKVVLLR